MIKSKKQMFIVISVFTLILLLGTTTYAFFNYTRTGSSNVIKIWRIAFTTSQGTPINLTNVFPIEPTQANLADNTKVGTVTIDVSGDTEYSNGIEYLVTATNVVNTVGSGANTKTVPISIDVTYSAKENKVIGTSSDTYFTHRGGNISYYLNTGYQYWTMSPRQMDDGTSGFTVDSSGRLNHSDMNASRGYRPAISLKPGVEVSSGTGTVADPYVIE